MLLSAPTPALQLASSQDKARVAYRSRYHTLARVAVVAVILDDYLESQVGLRSCRLKPVLGLAHEPKSRTGQLLTVLKGGNEGLPCSGDRRGC